MIGKRHRERHWRGVYMSGTAVCVTVASANPVAQCRCEPTPYALFFKAVQARWPISAVILFTPVRFPLPMFRSRANLVERQFRICIVIRCRLPDGAEIVNAGSPLCHWITGSWRPLDGHFERSLGSNRTIVVRVNSTLWFCLFGRYWLFLFIHPALSDH